jgi:hypothetical protein
VLLCLLSGAASGCVIESLEGETTQLAAGASTEIARRAGAPAPTVWVDVQLSAFAIRRFSRLDIQVEMLSEQGLAGQGVSADWSGAVARPKGDHGAQFAGSLSNRVDLMQSFDVAPCLDGPCVPRLDVIPRGTLSSDVDFDLRYSFRLELTMNRTERLPLESDLAVVLGVAEP